MLITTAMSFNACSDDGRFKDAQSKILVTECNAVGVTIPDDYSTMLSGDVLAQEANDTIVETYHDVDGLKKICTLSGLAYLIRE